jgi:glycosyltransferase involved in cell wall biosynthesis
MAFKPDVITNVFGGTALGVAAGVAGRFLGARSILRIAGDEIISRIAIGTYKENSPRHKIDEFGEYLGFNLADKILVMSKMEKKRVEQRLVNRLDRVLVRPRGIDLKKFRPSDHYSAPVQRTTFSYVGRKSLEKGYDIVESAAEIVERADPSARFRFAGTFDREERGNRNYVGFVEAEDLPAFYAESHAFILCSRNEGFPQAVMEAMAMGLPCILSRHLFEGTFKDGEDVLLVDTAPEAVAEAVLKLMRDPGLAARLAVRSRQIAERRFSVEKRAKIYQRTILGA